MDEFRNSLSSAMVAGGAGGGGGGGSRWPGLQFGEYGQSGEDRDGKNGTYDRSDHKGTWLGENDQQGGTSGSISGANMDRPRSRSGMEYPTWSPTSDSFAGPGRMSSDGGGGGGGGGSTMSLGGTTVIDETGASHSATRSDSSDGSGGGGGGATTRNSVPPMSLLTGLDQTFAPVGSMEGLATLEQVREILKVLDQQRKHFERMQNRVNTLHTELASVTAKLKEQAIKLVGNSSQVLIQPQLQQDAKAERVARVKRKLDIVFWMILRTDKNLKLKNYLSWSSSDVFTSKLTK